MPEGNGVSLHAYRSLGFVNNPFPPIEVSALSPFWSRVVTHAAANRLFSGVARASLRSRPILITMTEEVPDQYLRLALNEFLGDGSADTELSMLALNVSLDIMRLGTIRGALAEMAERVAASNLPLTVGLYFAEMLKDPATDLPEVAALIDGQITEAAAEFAADPSAAMLKYLGARKADTPPTRDEEFDALHMTYLRSVGLEMDPDSEDTAGVISEELVDEASAESSAAEADSETSVEEVAPEPVDPIDAMRDYLLALVYTDMSPVVARALRGYRGFGESMVAQELKVTKAPRKTLKSVLRLMSYRWKMIVFLWEGFDAWPFMTDQTRMDILTALNEMRWTFGAYGVMGVTLMKGVAPQLEETFAGAEQVDWTIPGFQAMYDGRRAWDAELVQSWIDSASIELPCPVQLDGSELAPIVAAAEGDVLRFALIAEVAFRDAASRGAATLDAGSIVAALASVKIEEGA